MDKKTEKKRIRACLPDNGKGITILLCEHIHSGEFPVRFNLYTGTHQRFGICIMCARNFLSTLSGDFSLKTPFQVMHRFRDVTEKEVDYMVDGIVGVNPCCLPFEEKSIVTYNEKYYHTDGRAKSALERIAWVISRVFKNNRG